MRILIVEDESDIHRYYAKEMVRAKVEFDIAESLIEALEFLNARSYEAAIVDLNLTNDQTFSHGKEVLARIREINEGTVAVVVSATSNVSDTVDSYEGGAVKFIEKSKSTNQDVAEYVIGVAKEVKLSVYGEFGSLNAYLASPDVTPIWEMQIYEALKCGFDKMQHAIMHSFQEFLPIRRVAGSSESFKIDVDQMTVSGVFWSRRIGTAILVTLSPNPIVSNDAANAPSEILKKGSIGQSVNYEVRRLDNLSRDHFFDKLNDTKVVK